MNHRSSPDGRRVHRVFLQDPLASGTRSLFPTLVRATGQGFTYDSGRAIGSVLPAVVGYLSVFTSLGRAIGVCAFCSYMLVLIAEALPETQGKEL